MDKLLQEFTPTLKKKNRTTEDKGGKVTIHEPASIRRNISFSNDKVKISKDLNNFQKYSMFISTVHLQDRDEDEPRSSHNKKQNMEVIQSTEHKRTNETHTCMTVAFLQFSLSITTLTR